MDSWGAMLHKAQDGREAWNGERSPQEEGKPWIRPTVLVQGKQIVECRPKVQQTPGTQMRGRVEKHVWL